MGRKVEGSHAVARQTAELLRSVVSQHRMGSSANQAAALADAVRAVGEKLIAANPIGKDPTFVLLNCDAIVFQLNLEGSGCFIIVSLNTQKTDRMENLLNCGNVYWVFRIVMSVHCI